MACAEGIAVMVVQNYRNMHGFTLIELMIVLVIIGVIAAIAFPSYTRFVERTQVNDGRAGLTIAAQELERCYVTTNSYFVDPAAGTPTPCPIVATSPEGFYTLAVAVTDGGQGFIVTAEGAPGSRVENGPCSEITLNQAGVMEMTQAGCPH